MRQGNQGFSAFLGRKALDRSHSRVERLLQSSLFYERGNTLDNGVLPVFFRMESGFKIHAEESAEGLPESGSEAP